jgi:signal peptidase I
MIENAIKSTARPGGAAETAISSGGRMRNWLVLGGGLLVLLALLRACISLTFVVGGSMAPTLATGDLLVVNKLAYRSREPQRGDIVVARYGRGLIVKRIVGLPAEEVEVKGGEVYINRVKIVETYPVAPGALQIGSGRLADGKYALLGDNRDISAASMVHAIMPLERVVGKVIWSLHW